MKKRFAIAVLGLVCVGAAARGELRVVDGFGAFFGYPMGTGNGSQVVHLFGSDAVALDYDIPSGGLLKTGLDGPAGVPAFFASTDCSGTAYAGESGLIPHGIVVTHNPDPFDTVYYPSTLPGAAVDIQSQAFLTPDGVTRCTASGGGFGIWRPMVTAHLPYVPPPLRVVGP